MMETTKATCVYLEPCQIRYLKLISMINGFNNNSEYIRTLLDDDMEKNQNICEQYSQILFAESPKSL